MRDTDIAGLIFALGLGAMVLLVMVIPPAIVMLIVYLAGGSLLPTFVYVQGVWALIVIIHILREIYGR